MSTPLWFFSLNRVFDKHASDSWPLAYGEVLSSQVYKRSGRSVDWCIKLRYRYVVGNQVLTSGRLSTSLMGTAACDRDKKVIDARFEQLHPGAKIAVRYKPTDPEKGIIYQDDLTGLYIFLALAAVLSASGIKAIREAAAVRPT
jgi:hypothetical protein